MLTLNKIKGLFKVYDKNLKFKNQENAEKYFNELRISSLNNFESLNKLLNNKFDFSPESLIELKDLYLEINKNKQLQKKLKLSITDFRLLFGIYRFETYVKNKLAIWTVEQFFESNAYTFGIKTYSVLNMRNHILPEIVNDECEDFYKSYKSLDRPYMNLEGISDELKEILLDISDPTISEDGQSNGFLKRNEISKKVKEKYNAELIKYIENESNTDAIISAMYFIREQLKLYYDYNLVNKIIEKSKKINDHNDKYYVLTYLKEIRKCKNVEYKLFFTYANSRFSLLKQAGIENLGSFDANKNEILEFLFTSLDNPKNKNYFEYVIEAIGNLGNENAIEKLNELTKSPKHIIKNKAKQAIEKILHTTAVTVAQPTIFENNFQNT